MPEKVRFKNVRLSFPVLWKPEPFETGGKLRYGCALLVDKDDVEQVDLLNKSLKEAGIEKWGPQKWADPKFRKSIKLHARQNGDDKSYDGYENVWAISANRSESKGPPKVVDWDGQTPLSETDARPYGGCYVNALVDFYGDDRYGRAINCGLVAIQFAKHGPAFAGGSRYEEGDFDALDPEEMGEDRYADANEGDETVDAETLDDDPLA